MTEHNITDEMVMALADGELQPHEAEAVRAAIDKEPRLKKLYDDMIRTGEVLEKAFGDLSEGAAYDKLVQQIRTEGAAPQDLRPKPENVVWLNFEKLKIEFPEMRRMAASLVVGLFLGGISWQAYMTTAVDEKLFTDYDLALLHDKEGYYGKAEPLLKRALAIDEKALGPEHPYVATDLSNLAQLYSKQGRYGEAEPLMQRALEINEKALVATKPLVFRGRGVPSEPQEKAFSAHINIAQSLNNLAGLYQAQGRYGEAEPLLKRALAINEKALGLDHPRVATSLNNLASFYSYQGRSDEAEPLFKRAQEIVTEAPN